MTTFAELKDLVYKNIGRDSTDSLASAVVPAAINYAIKAASVLFKPPELYATENVVISNGTSSKEFTTEYIDILTLYNVTDSANMYFVPYELFYVIIPTHPTAKYYTFLGDLIIVNLNVTADTTVRVAYVGYPTELSDEADEVEFDQHDAYIVSAATAIAFAAMEENETVDMWAKVAEAMGLGNLKAAQAREFMANKLTYLESAVTGSLTGVGSE